MALWRSLAGFDGRWSLRTWVYRVAHNTATSKVTRQRARERTLVTADDPESLAAIADEERALDRRLTLERLYVLIHRLRPIDRQVMLLYLEDADAASIAEIVAPQAGAAARGAGHRDRRHSGAIPGARPQDSTPARAGPAAVRDDPRPARGWRCGRPGSRSSGLAMS
jgi:RNA polymerase sigma-70 factor (ECF subfamily)